MLSKQITTDFVNLFQELQNKSPLVHNITNYVTVNDVANILLAIGASPIMADAKEETADITSISSALVINIGTLNERTINSMILSGKKANEMGIPVVLDPVGAGASALRNETTKKILSEVKISIVRGNLSEVSFIAGLQVKTKGVDVSESDLKNDAENIAKQVALTLNCVVVITGKVDVVSDGNRIAKVSNGVSMLSKVTGTGCMTSALTGAYAAVAKDMFIAGIAGVSSMGIAGEIAFEKSNFIGTGTFRVSLIDAISKLDSDKILKWAKVECAN